VPRTEIVFYREAGDWVPVREWFRELLLADPRAHSNCVGRIERLAESGHELRRPISELLRDGIHGLRARRGHVNYRVLYFFHGRQVAVLVHALRKESSVPETDIRLALNRKAAFQQAPELHTPRD